MNKKKNINWHKLLHTNLVRNNRCIKSLFELTNPIFCAAQLRDPISGAVCLLFRLSMALHFILPLLVSLAGYTYMQTFVR